MLLNVYWNIKEPYLYVNILYIFLTCYWVVAWSIHLFQIVCRIRVCEINKPAVLISNRFLYSLQYVLWTQLTGTQWILFLLFIRILIDFLYFPNTHCSAFFTTFFIISLPNDTAPVMTVVNIFVCNSNKWCGNVHFSISVKFTFWNQISVVEILARLSTMPQLKSISYQMRHAIFSYSFFNLFTVHIYYNTSKFTDPNIMTKSTTWLNPLLLAKQTH